jgi:hypothetical protein
MGEKGHVPTGSTSLRGKHFGRHRSRLKMIEKLSIIVGVLCSLDRDALSRVVAMFL